jgi:GMP synthase (glutamine-hydrolysing)
MGQRQRNILLLQARDIGDPMLEHELSCFRARIEGEPAQIVAHNLVESSVDESRLDEYDVIMVGGSGAYSCVEGGFDWHGPTLDLMREIVSRSVPMFASCFGLHLLVQSQGGLVETVESAFEVGTFQITLEPEGRSDDLLKEFPADFPAQLGHKDSVVELPDHLVCLARSARCAVQALRIRDKPIWATQFHPELSDFDNIHRYMRYIESYLPPGKTLEQARESARASHWPSPDANRMMTVFLRQTNSL